MTWASAERLASERARLCTHVPVEVRPVPLQENVYHATAGPGCLSAGRRRRHHSKVARELQRGLLPALHLRQQGAHFGLGRSDLPATRATASARPARCLARPGPTFASACCNCAEVASAWARACASSRSRSPSSCANRARSCRPLRSASCTGGAHRNAAHLVGLSQLLFAGHGVARVLVRELLLLLPEHVVHGLARGRKRQARSAAAAAASAMAGAPALPSPRT